MPLEFVSVLSGGERLYGVIHFPSHTPSPLVIASHGLFSSKESDKFTMLGERFSQEGIALLRYDHRGCGESEGDIGETTPSSRLQDLDSIFAFTLKHPLVDGRRIGLLGSSMGGFISIFKAASDPRVKALCLWATPAELRGKEASDPPPPLRREFFEDALRYDSLKMIEKVRNCLILHGREDELVPLSQAERLYQAAGEPKRLFVFEGGDHRFSDPDDRRRAVELSLGWFKTYL